MHGAHRDIDSAFNAGFDLPSFSRAEIEISNRIYRQGAQIVLNAEQPSAENNLSFIIEPEFESAFKDYKIFYRIKYQNEDFILALESELIDHISDIYLSGWKSENTEILSVKRRIEFTQHDIIARLLPGLDSIDWLGNGTDIMSQIPAKSSIGLRLSFGGRRFPMRVFLAPESATALNVADHIHANVAHWQQLPLQIVATMKREMQVSILSTLEAGAVMLLQVLTDGSANIDLQITGFAPTDAHLRLLDSEGCMITLNAPPKPKEKQSLADENTNHPDVYQQDATHDVVNPSQSPAIKSIDELPVSFVVELGARSITLAEVSSLTAGSILEFDLDLKASLPIRVNGHVVGSGQLIRINDQVAVQLTHWNR